MIKFKIVILLLFVCSIYSYDLNNFFKKNISFTKNNIPIIKMGITQSKNKITLRVKENFKFKEVIFKKGEFFTIDYILKEEGKYNTWLILDKFPYKHTISIKNYYKYLNLLNKKTIKIVKSGNLTVINGNIIDIRKQLLILGPFKNKSKAENVKLNLYLNHRLKTEFYYEIDKYPRAIITLNYKNKYYEINDILKLDAKNVELKNIIWGINNDKIINISLSGNLYFLIDLNSNLVVVNEDNIESLLKGIVPSEIFSYAPIDALKAQAVAARTDILAKIGSRHFDSPYHICGNQHCQVYKGKININKRTNIAVKSTKGEILKNKEGIIDAYYSANSGGYSENNENVWLSRKNISLRGRDDFLKSDENLDLIIGINENNIKEFIDNPPKSFSSSSSFARKNIFRWKKRYNYNKIQYFVNRYFKKYKLDKKCNLKDIKGKGRGVSGRLMSLVISCKNSKNNFIIYGELEIRRFLGSLKSSMFYMNKFYDKNNLIYIDFFGGGWGHGVGMCQSGAIGRAEKNESYVDILKHYYNEVELLKIY